MTIVRVEDLRACRYCASGARRWCASKGVDWRRLVLEGLPAEELEAIGDGMADAAVAAARKREACAGETKETTA